MHKSNMKKHVGKYHPGMGQIKQKILVNGKIFYNSIIENIVVFKASKYGDQQISNVRYNKEHNIYQDNTSDHISIIELSF